MAVIRGRLTPDNYTIVPNEWLRDPRLSLRGKGVLAYVMSHQAGYRLTVEQMAAQSRDGKDAIYSGLKELVEVGYMAREQRRKPDGTLGEVDYRIVEPEFAQVAPLREKPEAVASCGNTEKPQVDTASGLTGYGETGSGESVTKKEHLLEEQVLEDQKKPPPPTPSAAAPSAEVEPVEEEVDPPEEPPTTLALAALERVYERARVPASRRPVGARHLQLAGLLARAVRDGHPPNRLLDALCDPMDAVTSVYAVLRYRLDNLGPPAPPDRARGPGAARGPCPRARCDSGWVEVADRALACPDCRPDDHQRQLEGVHERGVEGVRTFEDLVALVESR